MIEGLNFIRSARPGKPVKWYVYAWRGKDAPCIMTAEGPSRPKLTTAALLKLAEAQDSQKAIQADMLAGVARTWCGSPADLSTASPEWRALAKSTRDLWRGELDLIEAKWGELPVALWNDHRMIAKVIEWRDSRAATPRAADQGVNVLSELLKFAKLRALIKINVAADVPAIYRPADRAEIIWTPADLERARAAAKALYTPVSMDIIELACLTGMRRADLAALTWAEVSDHAIIRTALKKSRGRRRRAVIPMFPALATKLAELRKRYRAPGVNHVLVGARGHPWKLETITANVIAIARLGNVVEPAVPELDLPARRKHLHDCRGTFVTHLCRAGLTDEEIANIAAWSVASVARIRRTYVDDASVVISLANRIAKAV